MLVEKRPMFHHDVVDKQVEDLRERMRLLQQDRRANIDLLDANKVANGNEIRSLKDENKKLRLRLTNLQKSAALDHDSNHGDLENIKKIVLQKRSDFDTQKASADKLAISLNKLKDEARICRLEEKRPSHEDGPLTRQIRLLENRLDKAMIQYNEAQGICSTYEHIVKRLKEERVSFDNQLTALERTLQSKQRDYDELVLLSGDASHAREVAQQNLHKSKCSFEEVKGKRARDVRERQQHVKIRKQMIQKQERSDAERRKALGADGMDSGDMSASSNSITVPVPIGHRSATQQTIEDQESTLGVYENAFRKIKDATGVSNVNEVIRKIVGQESTTESLITLTKQNQSRVEDLAKLQESLAQGVEKAKYSVAGSSKSSKTVDEQQEFLYSRSSIFERTKSQFDRLALVIVSISAGVEHVRDKLGVLPEEFDVDNDIIIEDTLPDVIRASGDTLVDVHNKTREKELKMHLMIQDTKFTELKRSASRGGNLQVGLLGKNDTKGKPFNQRITLPSAKEISAFEPDDGAEIGFGDVDAEEEISRDGVKKASSNIIATEERRKLRSRKIEDV